MTDLRLRHPHSVLASKIGADPATVAIEALRRAGWHLISDAVVAREDDVPGDFDGSEPLRRTRVQARFDGEVITASGHLSQYLVARAEGTGYRKHADAELGRDFLAMLGHRFGVPGCEDTPERLRQAGHP